jgi:hypothetical protein
VMLFAGKFLNDLIQVGSGGKEITADNVSEGIFYCREFAKALAELVSAKLNHVD